MKAKVSKRGNISQDRVFQFGKYEGVKVSTVIQKDTQYFEWANSKMPWIFTDYERQQARNLRSRQNNTDISTCNVKHRTKFEEEMYILLRKIQ